MKLNIKYKDMKNRMRLWVTLLRTSAKDIVIQNYDDDECPGDYPKNMDHPMSEGTRTQAAVLETKATIPSSPKVPSRQDQSPRVLEGNAQVILFPRLSYSRMA